MEVPEEAVWKCCSSSCLLWLHSLYNHLLQTQPGQKAAVGTVEGREVQIWALLTPLCRDGIIRNHSIDMLSLKDGCIFIFIFLPDLFWVFIVLNFQQQRLNEWSSPFPLLFQLFGNNS